MMQAHDDQSSAGLVLVPHFHWDREWYEPFQVFRHRLVTAVDEILDLLDSLPGFRFTLDGQTAAALDYLEMRPENRDRFIAAVRRGQLAIGPWYILLDEFLSSGETIIRNLQMGMNDAEELGGSMNVGYLPDMFGHIAQMPQILRKAGIEHAVFWRGVPARVTAHAFRWNAPDGSSVRAEYLFDGYGNGLDLLLVPDNIPFAIANYQRLTKSRWGSDPILGMAGTDHLPPRADLTQLAARFSSTGAPISIATIAEYVTSHIVDEVETTVAGELRSHARGNILPGVLSVRRGLKQAMALAERTAVEAERITAFWSRTSPAPFLDLAWRKIVESTAHDSVVGSGTDETVEQVAARLSEAAHTARAVRDGVLSDLARDVPSDGWLVWNSSTAERQLLVSAEAPRAEDQEPLVAVDASGNTLPTQLLTATATVLADETMDASDVTRVLRRIHRRELFGLDIDHVELSPGFVTFHLAAVPTTPSFDLLDLSVRLAEMASEHRGEWRVITLAERRETVLVQVPVPPSGLAAFRLASAKPQQRTSSSLRATQKRLRNQNVEIEVADDGTLKITGEDGTKLSGVGRIVDGGDRGDSYNYGPPLHDRLIDVPDLVDVSVIETGPLRAVINIQRDYQWPATLGTSPDQRSEDVQLTRVNTRVELHADDPVVYVQIDFENRSENHRVRMHVPLPQPVSRSDADGQFFVTTRGLEGEGGWGEFPIPTYPADAFVSAGPITVLLDHASEYELVNTGSELAITVLRSVGSMSVNLHPLRDEPAGSEIPVPGAQELGRRVTARFGILADAGGWARSNAVIRAAWFREPGRVTRGRAPAGSALPSPRSGLSVSGRNTEVSSLRKVEGGLELRLVNLSDEMVTPSVTGPFSKIEERDLLGRPLEERSHHASIRSLNPWEISTLLLSD